MKASTSSWWDTKDSDQNPPIGTKDEAKGAQDDEDGSQDILLLIDWGVYTHQLQHGLNLTEEVRDSIGATARQGEDEGGVLWPSPTRAPQAQQAALVGAKAEEKEHLQSAAGARDVAPASEQMV